MENQFELLKLERKGENTLHGLKCGVGKKLAIHFHGSWGNFYENNFALGLAKTYNQFGYTYASVNLPGHDGQTIYEHFDDSIEAIASWCNQIADDESSLVLQGHSLGALKIMRMAQMSEAAEFFGKVQALVLLSPFDLVSFYGGRNSERRRSHAKEFRDQYGENAILPDSIYDLWPISVSTYLELSDPESEYDLFPTRKREIGYLSKIEVPTLVALGSNDNASDPTPEDVMTALEDSKARSVLIEGAPHNFAGFESELSNHIEIFLNHL